MRLSDGLASVMRPKAPPLTLPYADWKPDLPDYQNDGSIVANGVIPQRASYGPVKSLAAVTDALTARCQGFIAARDKSNNVYLYAGDVSKLYEGVANEFTDQSVGGGYTVGADDVWEFVVDDTIQKVIATNFTDAVQSIEIGKGSSTNFATHITSTDVPKFKHIGIVRDFLVGGNFNDSGGLGHVPNGLWWGAIRDSTDFDADATTQSDRAILDTGGWVQRVIGGAEYGVVFQENLIRRMTYVGSPLIFDVNPVDRRRGTHVPNSVIGHGRNIFYWSNEGVFVFTGTESIPIGEGMIDKTLTNQFDPSNKTRVSAAVDPINKIVAWAFPGSGASAGAPNKIYYYKWDDRKWSEADIETEILTQSLTAGYTLEGLDTPMSSNIDAPGLESFDSDLWKGGLVRFGAFDTSNKLGYFTGSNIAATLETAEVELAPGYRSRNRKLRPLVDGGTLTAAVAGRNRLIDTATFGPAGAMDRIGEIAVNDNSRYQRFRTSIAAGGEWSHSQGIQILSNASGRK